MGLTNFVNFIEIIIRFFYGGAEIGKFVRILKIALLNFFGIKKIIIEFILHLFDLVVVVHVLIPTLNEKAD